MSVTAGALPRSPPRGRGGGAARDALREVTPAAEPPAAQRGRGAARTDGRERRERGEREQAGVGVRAPVIAGSVAQVRAREDAHADRDARLVRVVLDRGVYGV